MIPVLQWTLLALVAVLSAVTVRYSFRARRAVDPRLRALNAARMNISMGAMVIAIACLYMLLFSGSTLKVIVGAVLILLGLFNIFAGLRNHAVYSRKEG